MTIDERIDAIAMRLGISKTTVIEEHEDEPPVSEQTCSHALGSLAESSDSNRRAGYHPAPHRGKLQTERSLPWKWWPLPAGRLTIGRRLTTRPTKTRRGCRRI